MIVVLGSRGLLGSWICTKYPKDVIGFSHKELDITDRFEIDKILTNINPDAVINAAGIVKSRTIDTDRMFEVNGYAPVTLSAVCDMKGIKLVHVSTDCVFSGNKGNYSELDEPDCEDPYGNSKLFGEVVHPPHLTVRTSFVGWFDISMRGLLADYAVNSRLRFPGYTNVMWNGLTSWALADHLIELAYGRQTGLMHLFGQTVSKYELLNTFKSVFSIQQELYPAQAEKDRDMTLTSIRHDQPVIPGTTNLEESMKGMYTWQNRYMAYLSSSQ